MCACKRLLCERSDVAKTVLSKGIIDRLQRGNSLYILVGWARPAKNRTFSIYVSYFITITEMLFLIHRKKILTKIYNYRRI